jgi:hypothetical protein
MKWRRASLQWYSIGSEPLGKPGVVRWGARWIYCKPVDFLRTIPY